MEEAIAVRRRRKVSPLRMIGKIIEVALQAVLIIVVFGGALYLVGGCMAQVGRAHAVRHYYNTRDYLKSEFGLDTSRSYHLELGAPTGGGVVGSLQTEASFSLFGGHASTSAKFTPSSAIRLGFRSGDASYIIEIPYSKVKFIVIQGVRSHIKFVVDRHDIDYRSRQNVGHHFFLYELGHLEKRPPPIQTTGAWRRISNEGLPSFLNKHLIRVVLTLTPMQYGAYLGTLQPGK